MLSDWPRTLLRFHAISSVIPIKVTYTVQWFVIYNSFSAGPVISQTRYLLFQILI